MIILYGHLDLPNERWTLLGFNVIIIDIPALQQCDIVACPFSNTHQVSAALFFRTKREK